MSVRLLDLNPTWIDLDDRLGLGVMYDCLVGTHNGVKCDIRNLTLFANPLDGGPAWHGSSRELILKLVKEEDRWLLRGCGDSKWHRIGDDFKSLSMQPSVNMYSCGHMTLTNGVFN